jgi:hypothetical protein
MRRAAQHQPGKIAMAPGAHDDDPGTVPAGAARAPHRQTAGPVRGPPRAPARPPGTHRSPPRSSHTSVVPPSAVIKGPPVRAASPGPGSPARGRRHRRLRWWCRLRTPGMDMAGRAHPVSAGGRGSAVFAPGLRPTAAHAGCQYLDQREATPGRVFGEFPQTLGHRAAGGLPGFGRPAGPPPPAQWPQPPAAPPGQQA